jgi:hypothetical protein
MWYRGDGFALCYHMRAEWLRGIWNALQAHYLSVSRRWLQHGAATATCMSTETQPYPTIVFDLQ